MAAHAPIPQPRTAYYRSSSPMHGAASGIGGEVAAAERGRRTPHSRNTRRYALLCGEMGGQPRGAWSSSRTTDKG